MAYYLWPPQWIGGEPEWADRPDLPMEPPALAEVVTESELPSGIRIRAYRDGMLAFRLGSWGEPVQLGDASFDDVAEYQTRCARLMNAHLACLVTASALSIKPTVVTPDRLVKVRWADARFEAGGGVTGMLSFELWRARNEFIGWADWRLRTRHGAIGADAMNTSIELLRTLLDRTDEEVVLLRAELLLRAAAAYGDHDHSAALVHAWTATEGLLGDLLGSYIDEREDMNYKRKQFLKGSGVSARVTAELLSIAGVLPLALYRAVVKALSRRNDWLHAQKRIRPEDAEGAIQAAQDLFGLVEGVQLRLPMGRGLSSIG